MINKLITAFFVISVIFAMVNNTTTEMSSALLNSSELALKTVFSLVGGMALWGGVMEVAKSAGLTEKLCRLIKRPVKPADFATSKGLLNSYFLN